MDAVKFVEATRQAGGNAAQLYTSMVVGLDADALKRLRNRAADLDVRLEIHGGTATADRLRSSCCPWPPPWA